MSTIQNLNNTHIAPEADAKMNEGITAIETTSREFLMNLTADERRRYGSINEQNKLFVNKTWDYAQRQPELRSPDVDWEEFENDFTDRALLESYIARLQKIIDGLNNAKTLHDFDNFQAALDDYAYTSYKTQTAAPGYETKQRELKQFFSRTQKNSESEQ